MYPPNDKKSIVADEKIDNTEAEDTQAETAPEAAKPEERKFSQAELNAMLAKEKRAMQKKIEDLQKQVKDKESFTERLQTQKPQEEVVPEPTDVKGRLELMEKRYRRLEEDAKKNSSELSIKLEAEKKLRRESERDKQIGDALVSVGCTDMVGGRRYILAQVDYVDEDWIFTTRAGNPVTILEGVTEELPPYLRPASMSSGGSGSQGTSNPRVAAKRKQLEVEEAKLKALYAAGGSGRGSDMLAYQNQKKIVEKLRREAATTK